MDTPLISALTDYIQQPAVPFHTPGHKLGAGMPEVLRPLAEAYRRDLPDLPGFDLFDASGVVGASQRLAAGVFGADRTWYLVNGSTVGVLAALLAVCHPGDRVLLPRNLHRSAISGVILAGLDPVFVLPEYDALRDLMHPPSLASIQRAMVETPGIRAVLLVSPSYHGVCADVGAIADYVHNCGTQGGTVLIVDEAHGAHFGFHPELPPSALSLGADLVVQSTHKTLGALTQGAMLHLRGRRVDGSRVTRALQLLQSSSPSLLLLASLEAATHQMATEGFELWAGALALARGVRSRLLMIPNLEILEGDGVGRFDLTRLTVFCADGFGLDERLTGEYGVTVELPMGRHVTFILTFGTGDGDGDRLVGAFEKMALGPVGFSRVVAPVGVPEQVMGVRDAFFAASRVCALDQAVGEVCAELVCPYPPGIPLLLPGERLSGVAVEYLRSVVALGGYVVGFGDEGTLRVIS